MPEVLLLTPWLDEGGWRRPKAAVDHGLKTFSDDCGTPTSNLPCSPYSVLLRATVSAQQLAAIRADSTTLVLTESDEDNQITEVELIALRAALRANGCPVGELNAATGGPAADGRTKRSVIGTLRAWLRGRPRRRS